MRYNVYAIYDVKTQMFHRPFFCQADGEATRVFVDLANDTDHPIGKHPEDYTLHRIGTYEDTNAMLDGENPFRLMTALEATHTQEES